MLVGGEHHRMPEKNQRDAGKLAVIYARYSSHNQRDVSIDQQVKADREFAERQDLKIIDIYADRALTGTNDNRPEFQRMIADAKKGTFQDITPERCPIIAPGASAANYNTTIYYGSLCSVITCKIVVNQLYFCCQTIF